MNGRKPKIGGKKKDLDAFIEEEFKKMKQPGEA